MPEDCTNEIHGSGTVVAENHTGCIFLMPVTIAVNKITLIDCVFDMPLEAS